MPADIASIITAGLQLDEPALEIIRAEAQWHTNEIRELAEPVVCYAEDMEYVETRTDLMRLPVKTRPHPAPELNDGFHTTMKKPLYKWASRKGFAITPQIFNCKIIWLQGGLVTCPEGMVAMLIFVRRPRRRGCGGIGQDTQGTTSVESTMPEEPPSEGVIRSPLTGPVSTISADSLFRCQVGEMIFLEAGEQVIVRGDARLRDICMCCILHRTTSRGGTGEGGAA
ncbi:hypothetical protein B0T18DRAFT_404920 [Schizothecium vesticola]|uniref:Uncharacterized protein n=1 Tax=Schizothecium vesticola TaxID=314040 RepID=A0AA40KB01_9PEZI|nr:hypothetical protein B0T18DRAFT_404920 [Schizothecium vesticola]